ncbi:hypothetical protein Golob_003754, partial [Gossypium lobatum]|nr:hypothetical protein [Gossypium lobatum]
MIKDCPKKAALSTIEANDEKDEVTKNLNSILGGVEYKTSCGLLFVDITMVGKRLNALVDTDRGMTKGVEIQLDEWTGKDNIKVIPLDDFDFVVGLSFLDWINARVRRDEASYIATSKVEEVFKPVNEIPKEVRQLLWSFRDVMLAKLPKELPPKRDVDHIIEL